MLTRLRLSNYTIVPELDLELGPGLTVLTGETGAGKSIFVEAIALVLGGRARRDAVRRGAREAVIEAVFEDAAAAGRLEALGLPAEESLVVRRAIAEDGRGRISLNGSAVSAAMLARATEGLVDLVGQGEHHLLASRRHHLALLDAYAGLGPQRARLAGLCRDYAGAAAALAAAAGAESERLSRQDFLGHQIAEIASARLEDAQEDERLETERRRLQHAARLLAVAGAAEEGLYAGEGSAAERLGRAASDLARAAEIDPQLAPLGREIDSARLAVEEVASALRRYGERLEADPGRLAALEDRLDLLGRLKRKHGGPLARVLARGIEMAEELGALERHEERLAELEARLRQARTAAVAEATDLSRRRRRAAARFAREVSVALEPLGLPRAAFSVEVAPRRASGGEAAEGEAEGEAAPAGLEAEGAAIGPAGMDRVEFLFAPNPGEGPRPLQRIASGGERARLALAVRLALAEADPVGSYVFDEVDAGIGGETAGAVGRRIAELGRRRQVLCISHLPQIAALADVHLRAAKRRAGGRTVAEVRRLAGEERQREIARLLGGPSASASALAHASELLGRRG